ncbi:MAG: DUF475 domain-containing protein [Bacteroidetes bacterium]|nr:DUF475 domain-containing protein [Bacteroidota bacterium]
MESVVQFFSHFLEPDPRTAFLVVLNLILIESLLSVDNAAVLATMVMDLPSAQRKRALRIGIVFAYIFRGVALISASYLMKISWLKLVGGGYLLYLALDFFYKKIFKQETIIEIESEKLGERVIHPKNKFGLSHFWSTVLMVEIMDLTFSLDNVFAAVAFTNNIYLVCLGVFIGIITMRIVAGYFVKLMSHFPFLDTVAFVVIALLGLRLCLDFASVYFPASVVSELLKDERTNLYFSLSTVIIFALPILTSVLFNLPAHKKNRGK